MDPVTHLLAGYLIGHAAFGSGPLVAWATFMAFFPDVDTVSWVLPGPFRRLRHRGVTHSLVVGVAVSAVAAVAFQLGAGIAWWAAFAAGLAGFLSHVLLDVANWGCLLAWPFRRETVEFTVQQGLGGPFVASAMGATLLAVATIAGRLDEAVALVAALWLAYLLAKVAMKLALVRRHARGASVYPTAHPLRWRVIESRVDADGRRATRYVAAEFAPRLRERALLDARHDLGAPALPLRSGEEAVAFTFRTPEIQALVAMHLSLAPAVAPAPDGGWVASWYVLDYHRGDACLGALVRVAPDGRYEARKARLAFPPPPAAPAAPAGPAAGAAAAIGEEAAR